MSQSEKNQSRILQDHVKKGKVLVPPFVAVLGPWNDVSWHYEILPEVIWIGLLHKMYGEQEGTNLALDLAQSLVTEGTRASVGFDSEIANVEPLIKERAKGKLIEKGVLYDIARATSPLTRYAPTTGLQFIAENSECLCKESDREAVKNVVQELLKKESRFTVMVQATIVYIAFVLDRLKTIEGLALARFPEIDGYPETEISMRIASSIRCSLMMLFGGHDQSAKNEWARCFWNQGIRNEVCKI